MSIVVSETPEELAHGFVEIYDLACLQGIRFARGQISHEDYDLAVGLVILTASSVLQNSKTMAIIHADHPQVVGRLEIIQSVLAANSNATEKLDWMDIFGKADAAERQAIGTASVFRRDMPQA